MNRAFLGYGSKYETCNPAYLALKVFDLDQESSKSFRIHVGSSQQMTCISPLYVNVFHLCQTSHAFIKKFIWFLWHFIASCMYNLRPCLLCDCWAAISKFLLMTFDTLKKAMHLSKMMNFNMRQTRYIGDPKGLWWQRKVAKFISLQRMRCMIWLLTARFFIPTQRPMLMTIQMKKKKLKNPLIVDLFPFLKMLSVILDRHCQRSCHLCCMRLSDRSVYVTSQLLYNGIFFKDKAINFV